MADVSVKIKADNQVKTGLQSALADVKKFSTEASKSAMPKASGGNIRSALKGLGSDLASASTPAEAFQAVATRVAGAFGKITSVVAGFAIGQIIAGQFDKITNAINETQANLADFQNNLGKVEGATSMEQAVAGFDRLRESSSKVSETINALKSDWAAMVANAVLPGDVIKDLETLQKVMGVRAAVALNRSLMSQIDNSKELTEVMQSGGKEGVDRALVEQKRDSYISDLKDRKDKAGSTEEKSYIQKAINLTERLYAQEDQFSSAATDRQSREDYAKKNAAAQKEAARAAEEAAADAEALAKKRADYDRQIALQQAKLSGDKGAEDSILQDMDFNKAVEGGATMEQAANIAAQNAALRSQADAAKPLAGSFDASSYQRIGLASNEFFDTRSTGTLEKDTRRIADIAKEVLGVLKESGTILLKTK